MNNTVTLSKLVNALFWLRTAFLSEASVLKYLLMYWYLLAFSVFFSDSLKIPVAQLSANQQE